MATDYYLFVLEGKYYKYYRLNMFNSTPTRVFRTSVCFSLYIRHRVVELQRVQWVFTKFDTRIIRHTCRRPLTITFVFIRNKLESRSRIVSFGKRIGKEEYYSVTNERKEHNSLQEKHT